MGFWNLEITQSHFEIKDDDGKLVATVKGVKNAKLFVKSWDYYQALTRVQLLLRKGGSDSMEKIEKVVNQALKENDNGQTKIQQSRRGSDRGNRRR